jgi:serine/threonine protein kinase
MLTCPSCGADNPDGNRFCGDCAAQLDELDGETLRLDVTLSSGVTVHGLAGLAIGNGRFAVTRELGRGGMGIVYLAHDERVGNDVALKVLPDEVRRDLRATKDLLREVGAAQRLSHPNIVRLHDYHEFDEATCLTMELISGQTLYDLIGERETIPPDEVIPWMAQVCAGLGHAHSAGVIHRDIKPQNLMLDSGESVKICDFGIANVLTETATRVTRSSTTGTLAYMPPEQLLGEQTDHRTDIYATCATAYHLLCGNPPFHRGDIRTQIERKTAPPIDGLSDDLNAIILRGLEKDPDDRWQSVEELGDALNGVPTTNANDTLSGDPETLERAIAALPDGTTRKMLVDRLERLRIAQRPAVVRKKAAAAREAQDWDALIEVCEEWLELEPDTKEPIKLLGEATTVSASRANELEDWDRVTRLCEKWLELEPDAEEPINLLGDMAVRKEKKKERKKQEQYRKTEQIRQDAQREMTNQNWERVVALWQTLLKFTPKDVEAQNQLKRAEEEKERYLRTEQIRQNAQLEMTGKNWERALLLWQALLKIEPEDEEAQSQLELARKQIDRRDAIAWRIMFAILMGISASAIIAVLLSGK